MQGDHAEIAQQPMKVTDLLGHAILPNDTKSKSIEFSVAYWMN
jgi:hypothetical protein